MLTRRTLPNEEKNKEKKTTLHGEDCSGEISDESVLNAQKFLWGYIDTPTKKLLIESANTDVMASKGIEISQAVIRFVYK
jgi:hypothetical protein